MNKKGFVFIETIITVVVLSTSLIMLYNTYSSSIYNEKERLNYDDVGYIYRTNQIRNFLEENTDIDAIKSYAFQGTYVVTIGSGFDSMFTTEQIENGAKSNLEIIMSSLNVHQMLLVSSDYILNCYDESLICKFSSNNLSYGLQNYLKSLNDASYDYYLVVEYAEKVNDIGQIEKCIPNVTTNCKTYYVSLGL